MNKNLDRITDKVYENLRDKLNLHKGYNVEVSYIWYEICMGLKKDDVIEHVKRFLSCNGRMKYIKPLYIKFFDHKKEEAQKFFNENK